MQYQYGTVNVTNDSETVTGDDTVDWTELKTAVDNGNPVFFSVRGVSEVTYQVSSMTEPVAGVSPWTMTLTAKYAGVTATNVAYVLHKDFTSKLGLPLIAYGDRQTASIMSRAMQTIDDKSHALKNGLYHVTADTALGTSLTEITDLRILPEGDKYYSLHYTLVFSVANVGTLPNIQFAWSADENVALFAGIARAVVSGTAGTSAEWQGAFTKSTNNSNTLILSAVAAITNKYLLLIDAAFRVNTYSGSVAPQLSLKMGRSGTDAAATLYAGSNLVTTEFE